MKSNTRKKILALFAAGTLAVAGAAWAVTTAGIFTPNNVAADMTDAGSYINGPAAPDFNEAISLSGTGTQTNDVILPDADTITDAIGGGTASGIVAFHQLSAEGAGDDGGIVKLTDEQVLTLKPGANFGIYDHDAAVTWAGANTEDAGMLRLDGGTTVVYGGSNNNPGSTTAWNDFNGGTFLINGNLKIAHSNAFGEGHVMLNQNTHMTIFDGDVSLGNKAYDAVQTSLANTQQLWLRRNVNITQPIVQLPNTRANVEINVEGVDYTIYSGLREYITDDGAPDTVVNAYGAGLLKNGSGPMTIISDVEGGAWHTRGTKVAQGLLKVVSSGTAKYGASLGRSWNDLASVQETQSAFFNYDSATAAQLAVPYKNYLVIDADGSVEVNRDQFFGHFSGAGSFTAKSWNSASVPGGVKLPQITIQTDPSSRSTNNYSDSDFGAESTFAGSMNGTFDLVLDAGYLPSGNTGAIFPVDSTTAWRKILRFTGENNNITSGDTTIISGILSAKTVDNLPPGSIFVGANDTRNGYKAHLSHVNLNSNAHSTATEDTTATFHAYGSFAAKDGQLVSVGTSAMDNDNTNWIDRGVAHSNLIYNYPGYQEGSPHAGLAADRGATMSLGNVEVYSAFMVNEEMRVNDDQLNSPRGWEGEVRFTDRYTFPNSTLAVPTDIVIDRGALHLEKLMENGFARVQINPTGTLSLGNDARDFTNISDKGLDVTFGALKGDAMDIGEDDQRVRLVVKPGDIKSSKAEARVADAIFNAGHIDYVGLGSGQQNRDKRIVIQLDLSQVNNTLQKGTWIKAIYSPQAINWNNLHFLRENSTTYDEDYAKVRVAYTNNATIDGNKVTARLDENMYAIYIYVEETVSPNPTPGSNNFTFDSTGGSVATNAQISGTALLKDNAGAPVASQDVTFYLFHAGVDTSNNANAIENMTSTTDANGVAAYLFNKGGYGNGANYVVKAVATGYGDGTKQVTTAGAPTPSGSSSSGCDAGFGAFALLAMAGGALVLRKKD